MTPYERPLHHLRSIHEQYPDAWIQVEEFRRERGRSLPAWPEWCYLPLAGAYAIVSGGGDNRVPLERMPAVGVLGALAAWRVTQGIYEYDETVLAALWDTPTEGEIPVEVLYRLPEWCVYVLTPGHMHVGQQLHGFFAHLEWDARTTRQELRFALDVGAESAEQLMVPLPLHLGHGTIEECIRAASAEARQQAQALGIDVSGALGMAEAWSAALEPLVSVLLYLCSEASEIHERAIEGAGRPHPRRPSQRYPKAPTTWAVAYRLGAAIREAAAHEERDQPAGSHARPRAHIRRAHWHTYLTGPRAADQRRELRWLPPIPVNVDLGQIVPTIRRVE